MRAMWKGNISFALVTIPVSLYSATKRNELSFHYMHKTDMSKVSYRRFCEAEDKQIEWDEMTRGYEYEKGQYIEITDEDLERADVEMSRTIHVQEFVKADEIDPVFLDKPYYLEPQKGGERAYALMREALAQSKRVGIARVVLKSKEHLAALKVTGNVLLMQTMRFAHETADPNDLKLPTNVTISPKEMDLANTLIDSMADTFDPKKYKDEYYEKVMAVIRDKVAGVAPQSPIAVAASPTKVVDLMEVLKQSLQATQSKKAAEPSPAVPRVREEEVVVVASAKSPARGGRAKKAR